MLNDRIFKRQTIARNSIYTAVTEIVINVLSIFVAGYVAKQLGVLDYGRFVFAFAFVDIFTLFSNMGLHTVQVREIARDKANAPEFFGITLIIRIATAVLTFLAVSITISFLDYPLITKQVVWIAGLALVFNYIQDSCKAVFKAYETMHVMAVIHFAVNVVSMVLRVLVLYLGFGLLTLSWTIALVSTLAALVPYLILRHYFFKPVYSITMERSKHVIRLVMPFYFSLMFWVIYKRADILLLSFLGSEVDVGWYSAAFMLISRLAFISTAVVGATFPVISRLYKTDTPAAVRTYQKGLLLLFVISLPMAIGCFLGADKIIYLIFDRQYENSIAAFQIIAWTIPFVFLSQLMAGFLNAFGKERIVVRATATYVIANVLANLILIPKYGFMGAATSLLISENINLAAHWFCIRRCLYVSNFSIRYLSVVGAGLIMTGVLVLMPHVTIFIYVPAGALVYTVSILLLKAYPLADIPGLKALMFNHKNL